MYPFLITLAFRDVRNLPLLSHDDGTINDEDFLVLLYDSYTPFDLEKLNESENFASESEILQGCIMFYKFLTVN